LQNPESVDEALKEKGFSPPQTAVTLGTSQVLIIPLGVVGLWASWDN
jgi:hypothetical protein